MSRRFRDVRSTYHPREMAQLSTSSKTLAPPPRCLSAWSGVQRGAVFKRHCRRCQSARRVPLPAECRKNIAPPGQAGVVAGDGRGTPRLVLNMAPRWQAPWWPAGAGRSPRRTTAVTGPPPENYDLKIRGIGGSRRVGLGLCDLGRSLYSLLPPVSSGGVTIPRPCRLLPTPSQNRTSAVNASGSRPSLLTNSLSPRPGHRNQVRQLPRRRQGKAIDVRVELFPSLRL